MLAVCANRVDMDISQWKNVAEIVEKSVTSLAVLVGGGWALWKFVIQRESHAKIEFDLELNVLGGQAGKLIVEVVAKVTNKGLVRHWLEDFCFDLLYLPHNAAVVLGDQRINKQVLFQPVIKKRYWIPPDWLATFIDPGVCQRYTYVAAAPADARFLLVFAKFKYPDEESEFHTAQKVFPILLSGSPANLELNPDARQQQPRAGDASR